MIKHWMGRMGLFSSPAEWGPYGAPAAGDTLFLSSGVSIIAGQTIGSAGAQTAISLIGDTAQGQPTLALWNSTLRNVLLSNTPAPYSGTTAPADYYTPKYGTVWIGGTVTNDGGTFEAARGSRVGGNNLTLAVQSNSTLVNKGTLTGGPNSQLTVTGAAGSTLENDGRIAGGGGPVVISAHLTGTGDLLVQNAGVGLDSRIELKAGADAGQTVHIDRGPLQLDQPASFLGQVRLPDAGPLGGVLLEGLSPSSWDVKGNLLELFDGAGARIDTLRFTAPQTEASLAVYARPDPTYGNTVLVSSSNYFSPPSGTTVLPYHSTAPA